MGLRAPCFLGIACLLACSSTGLADDQLKIENIADGDNVVVLMDSRTSDGKTKTWWCSNDEVRRTTGDLAVGTRDAAGGCSSEIAVFATGNAMALSFPGWTDRDGDIHTITMKPIIDVPVSVWIANAAATVRAPLEIANATWIYAQNKVGVQFVPTYHAVYSDPNAVAIIGKSCDSIGWIRSSAWYTPHTLNIYYVKNVTLPPELARPGVEDAPGLTCDRFGDGSIKGDANIIFISGRSGNLATLAHEIGHAFGLRPGTQGGHINVGDAFLKEFDSRNVMAGGGSPTRSHFSLGQAFRMNTQADEWGGTMLIANGLRPGPGRTCPPLTTSDICPPLALDWPRP
jgi:hypothetical protein